MRRSSAKTLSLIFLAVLLVALAACGGGGSSSSGTPSTIVLSPTTAALKQGDVFQITASVEDSGGNVLSKFTPSFGIVSGGNLVSVSVNGLVCAGQWDSLSTPVNCSKATQSGKATITASVGTVTSTPLIIDVLPPVDNLTIVGAPVAPDASGLDCISQSAATPTRTYTAQASFKGAPVDLSAVTDAITWSIASTVGTIAATTDATTGAVDSRTAVATAKIPGRTQVSAGFYTLPGSAWLQSTPADFTTCPVSKITLADSTGATVSPSPLSSAGTVTLTPTLTDSRGNVVNLVDSSSATIFSLLWNSSQPSVASAGTTGIVTANASTGNSSIIASCTPPACNSGLGTVYGNVYLAKVSGTTTTRTVYVGSATPVVANVTPTAGLTIFPMNTSDNSFGTAITLGDVPNSMLFDSTGANLYIGTNSGLIMLNTATNAAATPMAAVPGKVIAVSPDGNIVLVSNLSVVSDPTKSQVFAFSPSGGTFQTLNVPGAVAAAFAPDNSTAYIVGNNTLSVYSGGSVRASMPITGAQSASFLASGSLGYIAADGSSLGSKATCNNLDEPVITTSGTPTLVGTLVGAPDGLNVAQNVVAVAAPNFNLVNVTSDNVGFVDPAHGCAPLPPTVPVTHVQVNAGATFTPKQLIVAPDGSSAYVLSDVGSLLGISTGTTPADASIPLSGGAVPTTGGITLDSTLIFVGGSDGKIHRVDRSTSPATDTPIALPSTAPAGFTPDFVAVQPR